MSRGASWTPAQIANPHIRAHAAEGQFFREAAERAAEACGLAHQTFAQKSLYSSAAKKLAYRVDTLKAKLTALGAKRLRPWGGDEKEAALAAWIVLVDRRKG